MIKLAKLGILTGGGDAPGLNSAIKWCVKHALDTGVSDDGVTGIKNGWKGLLDIDVTSFDKEKVRTYDRDGGTNLGSSRTDPFNVEGKDLSDKLITNIRRLKIDYVIAMGGEGTLRATYELYKKGIKVVGIPKTIDKDVGGTDYTLGFASAVEGNKKLINTLRNPAGSHGLIYIVEVMGRNAGHLALHSGVGGGASIILIPEYPFSLEQVSERLKERRRNGARYDIVVVAEGAKTKEGREFYKSQTTVKSGYKSFGGVGAYLSEEIQKLTNYEARCNVPGHTQRGAEPNFYDVLMGRNFGIHAVNLVKEGKFGYMVSLKEGKISHVPLEEITTGLNLVNVKEEYDTVKLNAKAVPLGFP